MKNIEDAHSKNDTTNLNDEIDNILQQLKEVMAWIFYNYQKDPAKQIAIDLSKLVKKLKKAQNPANITIRNQIDSNDIEIRIEDFETLLGYIHGFRTYMNSDTDSLIKNRTNLLRFIIEHLLVIQPYKNKMHRNTRLLVEKLEIVKYILEATQWKFNQDHRNSLEKELALLLK